MRWLRQRLALPPMLDDERVLVSVPGYCGHWWRVEHGTIVITTLRLCHLPYFASHKYGVIPIRRRLTQVMIADIAGIESRSFSRVASLLRGPGQIRLHRADAPMITLSCRKSSEIQEAVYNTRPDLRPGVATASPGTSRTG